MEGGNFSLESFVSSHQTSIIFQISYVLAAFQKYYEFKNFVELLPYKKALEKSKESFYEIVMSYRSELLRPGRRHFKSPLYISVANVCCSGKNGSSTNDSLRNELSEVNGWRLHRAW